MGWLFYLCLRLFYYWDFGDGDFSNDFNPSHTFLSPGVFSLKLYARKDSLSSCEDIFEKSIIVVDPFLVVENISHNDIKILLNYNSLQISSSCFGSIYNCEIFDLSGKLLKSFDMKTSIITLDISDFPKGYFLIKFYFLDPKDDYNSKFFKL